MTSLAADIKKFYVFTALLKRFVVPILVLFMVDQGLSVGQVAIVVAAGNLVNLIFEVPSGAIADAFGHKRTLVVAMLIESVAMLCYLGATFWWILLGSALFFFGGTLLSGTRNALLFERLKQEKLEKAYAKYMGRAKGFANFVGIFSMILASLAYVWHWWIPFVVGSAQFFIAALIISSFRAVPPSQSVEKEEGFLRVYRHLPKAVRSIVKMPLLFWILIFHGVFQSVIFSSAEFHQILFEHVGLAVALFGVVYALKRAVTMILAPLTYWFTQSMRVSRFILFNALLVVSYLLAIYYVQTPIPTVGVILFASAALILVDIGLDDYANRLIDHRSRATTLSVGSLFAAVAALMFTALFGFLSELYTLQMAYLIVGLVVLGFVLLAWPFLHRAEQTS